MVWVGLTDFEVPVTVPIELMLVEDALVTFQESTLLEPTWILLGLAVKEMIDGFTAGGGGGTVTVTVVVAEVLPLGFVAVITYVVV